MERDGAQVMEQREKVARALIPEAWQALDDNEDTEVEQRFRDASLNQADAVLLALGLGEGGENVILPKAALAWLNGEVVDHEGKWFGESDPQNGRSYWWRSRFREVCDGFRRAMIGARP